ncbi:copper amine oxidase N-terminal domain-containing protein [[Clostridium] colinum]|uniref:copper amine oxidase N-terminal domain-containing protein n=1 Tax=[Clostridium] colinum TaxID=36835 RepID=UPI002023E89C|nr:copper amine oxidase N-terminal domain-containing protein [[Clostridium] colinum]
MKKNIKKIIPMIAIATLMTTTVFANNEPNLQKQTLEQNNTKENEIYINGELLENYSVLKENDKNLIPVRAVFEKLGYNVEYDTNTKTINMTKAPHFITFSTTKDAYTFSRMAPQPLGQAPIVKNGVTYVPIELFNLIGIEIELTTNNTLFIGEKPNNTEQRKKQIIIKDINEENNTITIQDPQKGEVVLNIKDVKIEYKSDDKNLMIGQALEVEYGDIMSASQPPINTPKSVKVVDKISYGEVLNVEKDDDNNTKVLFKDEEKGEIILNIAPDFKVEYTTKDTSLKKGQSLEVVLGKAMTMSIPPMTTPKMVKVVENVDTDNTQNQTINGIATIKNVDKENKTILVTDEKMGDVVLNLNDDVKIEYKNGQDLHAYNWLKEGQKLEIEYSPIMTRSLPPINNPIKITVLN